MNKYTVFTIQKFGDSNFLSKKLIFSFRKAALNWSKLTVKTFIMLQNIYAEK